MLHLSSAFFLDAENKIHRELNKTFYALGEDTMQMM